MKGVLPPLVILGTAFLLTLAEPDLGTASLILAACGSILLCAGLKKRHLFVLGATAVSGVVYHAARIKEAVPKSGSANVSRKAVPKITKGGRTPFTN